jgi:DNA-binding transcriptional regulator YhcF (GntR family)
MLLRVDPSSPVPLYEQLATAIRAAVAAGEAGAGERLPSARELAGDLNVNMHTVLRAYSSLRDEGLLELRRGRGAVIRGDGARARAALDQLAGALAAEARRQGLGREELHALVERRYAS